MENGIFVLEISIPGIQKARSKTENGISVLEKAISKIENRIFVLEKAISGIENAIFLKEDQDYSGLSQKEISKYRILIL